MPNHEKRNLPWGPDNPHPLSKMKTELVWDGKYDEYGNRRAARLPSGPMPLQRIETIDEPHDREKAMQPSFFNEEVFQTEAHLDDFRNLLIWGDNKLALSSLQEKFRGKVDLIYMDPPFDVGADFSLELFIGENGNSIQKEQSILEAVAYRDTWGKGIDSYVSMIYERLQLLKHILSDEGIVYLHCDWRVDYLIRYLLDEVLGESNFRNQIIWYYSTLGRPKDRFAYKHDTIFAYGISENTFFDDQAARIPYTQSYIDSHFRDFDDNGKQCRKRFDAGKWRIYYPDEGMIPNDVWEIPYENSMSNLRMDFPTQKPEALLERIIKASSKENALIADFFCGSGTTLAVAEKLGRRWIGVDIGRYAIHTTRKRMIGVQRELRAAGKPYRSFDIYNLGRYERQWWQMERLKGANEEHRKVVLKFYKAQELNNAANPLLHGKKAGAFVHISQIDNIFSLDQMAPVAEAAAAAGGQELHCLAWEFEMELALRKTALEAEYGITIRLKYIPREIMEANRTECQFFEAGALTAQVIHSGDDQTKFDVELVSFSPALAEAPAQEMDALRERAIRSPFDFIDFWAVDFTWDENKPFEHHWQDYRTRRDRSLNVKTDIRWEYTARGKHKICVKVIDVFGVDTTTILEVEV